MNSFNIVIKPNMGLLTTTKCSCLLNLQLLCGVLLLHVLNKNDTFPVDCPMHMEGVVEQYISFSKSISNPPLYLPL